MNNIACSLLSDELLDDSFSSTFGMDAYSEQLLRNFVEDVQSKIAEGSEPIGTESSTFRKVSKYINSMFGEEVDPTKLDSDLLSIWNEKLNASRSLSNNDKVQDLEIQEVPNLTNSLSDIFKDEVDWRNFLQSSKRRIILSTIINPISNSSIVDNYDLNNSMIGTQEFLATRLFRYLGLEPKPIYNGTLFNKGNYDELIKQAKLKFSTFFHNGKYSFNGNHSNRSAFNDYLLLTNFDTYITKFLGKTVAIDPNLVGVRQLPKQGLKYTQEGESIKQEWDDEKAGDIKLNTSSYVRDYVTSLEEMTPDRVSTGRYLMINEFNNLVTFIKDKANLAQLANIREYPDIVVKGIFDEIARNPGKYFTGKYKLLENVFFTIYHNVFNIDTNSLFATYNASTISKRNDLYSMICNQISKTSAANYIQTYYNNQKEVKAYVVDFLTSEAISTNKSELNRSVALGIATLSNEAKRNLFNQFQVKFYNGNNRFASENDKIQYVEFLVGGIKCKSDLKGSTISLSDAATGTKFNGYIPKVHIKNLINKLIRRSYSDDFYDSMLKSATSSEKDALLRYAANIFLSAKLSGLDRATINSKLVTDTDRFSGYNETFKVLRPDGYNKSLDAVDLLAKAISYENKEISKSYVKNNLGAFLSKTSLTSLGLDDYIQFGKNYKIAKEQGNRHPLYYNLFTNSQISESPLSLANFFKTEVVNFDGDTKQIKELSAADLSYEAFVFGYLINKKQGKGDNKGIIQIQSNEYSDKSKISGKIVDLFQRIKYVAGGFSINKSLNEMTDKEVSDLYYHSVSNQLRRLSIMIKRDYDTLFGILHDLYGDRFKVKNTLEEYKKELSKLSDDAAHTAVIAAQKQGIKLEIIPEIHFTGKEGKRQFNKLLDFMMTGVFANPEMFKDRMYNLDKDYAEKLRSLNVRFETILDNGEYNKALMNNIDKSEDQEEYITNILDKESFDKISKKYGGKTFEKIWVDNRFNELRIYIAFDKDGNIIEDPSVSLNDASKVVINPELHRFRMLNNLISDNYNLAITGMPFLHPFKVTEKDWSVELEEGARTVSYNKRGVIHGATIHPEAKNKMDGIPQVYNLAVIKDLESINMGLTGDNGDATQADGAIFRTGSIALWEKASIPELKGSYYQSKPIGYSYNPDHLSSTLLKCAMFTISNAVVRNSITNRIKMDNILRNMMDRPWLVPNLDLTDELSGKEFAYTNPETSLNSYFVVSDLEKTESRIFNNSIDNVYTGTITEYNIETGEMINSTTKSFSINSNYDLYKIMGGGYSGYRKLVKRNIGGKTEEVGEFIHDESSWENLAEIGSNINIESNSAEIEEYNNFIDKGLLIGKSKLFIPESLEIKDAKVSDNNIIPTKFLKIRSGNTPYFQPMKYSDVHYLANASAVKNGAANVNPAELYYNSVATRISPNDRLIFGHPTLGKTQAEKMGYNILDFDTFIRNENNEYIRDNALEGESRGDTLKRIGETPEYQQFVYDKLKEALATNRQVFFSKTALLRALNNPNINVDGIKLDKLITMSEEDFVRRDIQRGATDEVATRDWKHNLDIEINTYLSNNDVEVIDATGHNLYEYLGSSLTSIELDPSYIGLQLIAEHNIEDDEVSEMTQVISALIQNTYTADLAIKVLQDIGDSIANELNLYNKWDINTPEGRAEVNRILGKALVRVFANREGQEISLASAYLDNIKDELYNSKLSAKHIPNIPFDDNNILGMFETSFANGFNRDIIKRKFPGMAAVLNPSQDIYTLYDYNGQVITSADFMKLGTREQIQTLKDLLARLDAEVPVSEIREGDWVEYNGEVKQVGILSKATSDGVTLREIRNLRRNGQETIKKLGSKGRNLRAQNYKVEVLEPDKLNVSDVNFDLFDLDIVMFSHNLYRFMDLQARANKGEKLIDNDLLDYKEYSETFNDLRSYIDSVYYNKEGNPIARWDVYLRNWNSTKGEPKDKRIHREFGRYIIEYIQYEMKNLSEGKFHIPRAYRSGEDAYAMVLSEYIPNELAVGKPWANKFMLEVGDNLADINADFFYNKLRARRNNPLAKLDTNFYFCANNYVLNFGNQHIIDDLSIRKGYKVELINSELDLIANQRGIVRRINSEVYYPVNDNMKFYRITTPDNQVTEMVIDYTLDDAVNIWNSHSFYTNTINYPTGEADLEDLQKLLILDSEINNLEIDLDNIEGIIKSYQDAQRVANKIEADMRKQAAKMYRSFNEALKAIAARIPAQSMQSFMNMKIVGFTDVDSNLAYVPVNMLQYEGSDFDIDKIYMMMAGIGDNGVYADWSPYFDYSTDNGFELSKKLPLPTKKVLREDASGVDISEYVNLLDYQKNKQYYLFLSRLAEVLEATKNGIIKFDESVPEKDRLALVKTINKHNTYWHDASTAIKNKIFDTMYNISSNPRNYVAETTILDISIARDAARKSPMSKENSSNSNNNPAAMMIAQEQALVGKNTIGAFANGIKTFSACVVHYKTGIERANAAYTILLKKARDLTISLDLRDVEDPIAVAFEYLEQKMGELTDEERVAINNAIITKDLSNINNHYQREYVYAKILEKNSNIDKFRIKVNGKSELDVTINGKDRKLKFAHTLPNIDILNTETQHPALLKLIEDTRSEGAQQNVQDMLGILLNCATDNAKELILKVINASSDFASIYILLTVNGVSFEDIVDFMSSDFVTTLARLSERSVFNTSTKYNTIKSSLDYLENGVSITKYFGNVSKSAINNLIKVLEAVGVKPKKTTEKEVMRTLNSLDSDTINKMLQYISDNSYKLEFSENTTVNNDFAEDEDRNIKTVNRIFTLNRYLKECMRRNGIVKKLGNIDNNIQTMRDLSEAAEEFKMEAKILGINQGIKTIREDIFNHLYSVNKFFSNRLGKEFDLFSFITDSSYRNRAINDYEQIKNCHNLLDILASSPHFTKMYEAFATKERLNNEYSFKYRNYMKCAQDLKSRNIIRGNITSKDSRTIKRFLDEVVMDDFCKSVNFKFPYIENGFQYDKNNNLKSTNGGIISVDTPENRASFKVMMERIIIPGLQNKYSNNKFLQNLILDYSDLNPFRVINPFSKSNISFNSADETDQEAYTTYLNDFDSIKNEVDSFSGARIEDLFFLYNLIINNNSFGERAFTRIFSNSVRDQKPNSIITQFQDYIANLSSKEILYDLRDLHMRFADSETTFILRGDDGTYTLYDNGSPNDVFKSDNMTVLPFTTKTNVSFAEITSSIEDKILDLLATGNASVKLTCD